MSPAEEAQVDATMAQGAGDADDATAQVDKPQAELKEVSRGEETTQLEELRTELKEASQGKEVSRVEEPQAEPKTPQTKTGVKRKTPSPKLPPLEAMAAKIKRLQEEAEQADAAVDVESKSLQDWEAEVSAKRAESEAKVAALRSDAELRRGAARRASQEYIRKQCEAAIAHLDSSIPKRPLSTFFLFANEQRVQGVPTNQQNKRISEMWGKMTEQEKQPYKDRYDAEMKRFTDWGDSEEGRKNLQERHELIRKCKAAGMEELHKAVGVLSGQPKSSPTKHADG